MADYTKTTPTTIADTDLTATFQADPGGVRLVVGIPSEAPVNVPWSDVFTVTERNTLAPLLRKAAQYALAQRGFTAV